MEVNLSFDQNLNVFREQQTLYIVLKKFSSEIFISDSIHAFDKDTGDVLCFLPEEDISRSKPEKINEFLDDLRDSWQRAGFQIIEERNFPKHEFLHVRYASLFFRLKPL